METTPDPPLAGLHAPHLSRELVAALRADTVALADATVTAIADEVPGFAGVRASPYLHRLEDGVRMAYDGFLGVLAAGDPDGRVFARARRGAYLLGRDEARAGRSIDLLLGAYRVGSRVHWQELSRTALARDVAVADVVDLAAMVFAYIDGLSAASVSGHADESATASRQREERLAQLARSLASGEDQEALVRRAQHAQWPVPTTLTAVVVPSAHMSVLTGRQPDTLRLPLGDADAPGDDWVLLFVPDVHYQRAAVLAALPGRSAVVGPARPWHEGGVSARRALLAFRRLPRTAAGAALDTEDHLAELLTLGDPEVLADLRQQVLAPLADLPSDTASRLGATLLSWLLHQGRREDVAAALHVHPQTVRYRMNQVRDRFGDRLQDPGDVYALILALGSVDQWP